MNVAKSSPDPAGAKWCAEEEVLIILPDAALIVGICRCRNISQGPVSEWTP